MTQVLFFNPASSAQRKPVLPMSILALAATIEGSVDYQIIDGNLVHDPQERLRLLIEQDAQTMLAVTVMPGPQLHQAVPVCRALKRLFPNLMVVWGGYFPTQHADACLQSDAVDWVIAGHADESFPGLVTAWVKGQDISRVPGAQSKPGQAPGKPGAIPDPDTLPDFPYHRLDMEAYLRPTFMGKRTFAHHSSYGCPFFCNFCAVVNMVDGKWKAQSAGRVEQVIRGAVDRWSIDAVEFYDNNFFVSEARTLEFSQRITDLGIRWWGEARVDRLLGYSDETWQAMSASGLSMVFMGAESGSDETLQRMNKGRTAAAEKTLDLARRMRDWNVVPEYSFVVGNPPDPEADTMATLEFVRKLKSINPATEIIFYLYTPVPLAGDLYDQAQSAGFEFPTTLDEWLSDSWLDIIQRRSADLPWIVPGLNQKVRNFERVLNARYPTVTDQRLSPGWRRALKALSGWRYRFRYYRAPVELMALQKLIRYQRPETSGF